MRQQHRPQTVYPCPHCGTRVRSVRATSGHMIVIDEAPSPSGNIIPWPADGVYAAAQARIMEHPILSDTRWEMHSCTVEWRPGGRR